MDKKIALIVVVITVVIVGVLVIALQPKEQVIIEDYCGDGTCNIDETTENCPQDCGQPSNTLIFALDEGWGPCMLGVEVCWHSMKIYGDGTVVEDGAINRTIKISQAEVEEIIAAIRAENLFDKECPVTPVMDYGATYNISIDGREKIITFPGCENEMQRILDKITSLIPPAASSGPMGGA